MLSYYMQSIKAIVMYIYKSVVVKTQFFFGETKWTKKGKQV